MFQEQMQAVEAALLSAEGPITINQIRAAIKNEINAPARIVSKEKWPSR